MNSINHLKKFLCFVLIVLVLPVSGTVALQIEEAPERNPFIRVSLTQLALTDRLDITLDTSYLLTADSDIALHFQPTSQLTFQLIDEDIYLYYEGMSQKLGKSINLNRSDIATSEHLGFRKTHFPPQYLGDLSLSIKENKLFPILTLHVEDYLLGVVPYEMGNDFPLEALKAQAVAARTYALRSQNIKDEFDVYDNTNDQVFRGYVAGNDISEKAVAETKGVCGFYKGKLAQCYYSASNGGQTELVQMVWPSREELRYYQFGEDPYDVQNPASTVRSFEIKKQYKKATSPAILRQLVLEQLEDQLLRDGFDATQEGIQIDRVLSVLVDSPNMQNSKLMTMLHMEMEVSVRKVQSAEIHLSDIDQEEVTLFSVEDKTTIQESFQPVITVTPAAAQEVTYGQYVAWHEPVSIDIPIFPDAEKRFQLSINSNYENEIWSVKETADAFTIETRRFGHGVGMSQRGAQVMAEKYQMSFQDILAFYYPGMELMRYPEQQRKFTKPQEALSVTAGPAPSPTPRPTLMPATLIPEEAQWYAAVTEISDDSSLNLRSAPSLNSQILMRLYKGQRLLVLERCPEEGWVKVRTDVVEGYVMESYLSKEE